MAKRIATSDLNQDNWDKEDEQTEVAGRFLTASKDQISQRKIKVAKRRGTTSDTSGSGIFSGFAGFGATQPKSGPTLGTPTSGTIQKSSGFSTSTPLTIGASLNPKPTNALLNGGVGAKRLKPVVEESKVDDTKSSLNTNSNDNMENSEFGRQVKALNENVLSWIQQHVKEYPYVDLTPVFNDYSAHIIKIEKKYGKTTAGPNDNNASSLSVTKTSDSGKSAFKFGLSEEKTSKPELKFGKTDETKPSEAKPLFSFEKKEQSSNETKPLFSFGKKEETSVSSTFNFGVKKDENSTPIFKFGKTEDTKETDKSTIGPGFFSTNKDKPATSGFSFGVKTDSKPFQFGATNATTDKDSNAATETKEEEEPYKPPEVEIVEIEEDGAVYSIKCKLFYNKEGKFVDRGIGTLHLKPLDNGKTQCLIRAGTSLGTVLLNISLSESIPMERLGKNNVRITCIPNPPLETKDDNSPVVMLIRVKTGDEADKLLKKLKELSKGSDDEM